MKNTLALVITFFFVATGFSQSESKAILIDEFGPITCDDFLARIDYFYNELNRHPGSMGYFVISGGTNLLRGKLSIELQFESAVRQRGHDATRSKIVRGSEAGRFNVKIWIVELKAEKPDFGEAKWDLRLPPGSVPFRLRSDMEQICDPSPVGRIAKELLDSNPNGSLFVVVHGATSRERREQLRLSKKLLKLFDPNRVRYFLREHSDAAFSDYYFAIGNPARTAFKSYL
jgi:hypothetical protein